MKMIERPLLAVALPLCTCVIYLIIAAQYPVSLFMNAPDDDTLFMEIGKQLVSGNWLGQYNARTLVKGPGFPAFIALVSWSGLSFTVMEALLHCVASLLMGAVIWRLSHSYLLGFTALLLLLWHPEVLNLVRVIRDAFYADLVLLFLGLLFACFLLSSDTKTMLGIALLAGLVLGWALLTREEGVWLLPGIVVAFVGSVVTDTLRRSVVILVVVVSACLGVQMAFQYGNLVKYNAWVGVDSKEANYRKAVSVLQGVRSGEQIPYVPVSASVRQRIYEVSPAMRSIGGVMEPRGSARWQSGCQFYPQSCGDIAAGWFPWALRGSVNRYGHYQSPQQAARFYSAIVDEVESACEVGALDCRRSLIPLIPPMTTEQWATVPAGFWKGILMASRGSTGMQDVTPSQGHPELISSGVIFLNNPPYRVGREAGQDSGGSQAVVKSLLTLYYEMMPYLIGLGFLAFVLISILAIFRRQLSVVMLVAATLWTLVASRLVILVLIDASSFPAFTSPYLLPIWLLAPVAALVSIACLWQLGAGKLDGMAAPEVVS